MPFCLLLLLLLLFIIPSGDVFACFGTDWPGPHGRDFTDVDGWEAFGCISHAAGDEERFWTAVTLQANGGATSKWKPAVDFYLDADTTAAAFGRVTAGESLWLGLVPFAGSSKLWVSRSLVSPGTPVHRYARHPGMVASDGYQPVGLTLRLAGDGTYFEPARA